MKLVLFGVFAIVLNSSQVTAQIRPFGAFEGLQLLVDTTIEDPPVYSGHATAPLLKAGEQLDIQLFVPGAGGKQTLGYDINLANSVFSQYFSAPSGRDWQGSSLLVSPDPIGLTALLITLPTIPSSGYIGQITLTVSQDIQDGTTFNFNNIALSDQNSNADNLDISQASILFSSDHFVAGLAGDLDEDGDVDFTDFLTFAGNFGKTGPVPSGGRGTRTITIRDTIMTVRIDTVVMRDTIFQTIRDTISVATVIRDTIYISSDEPTPVNTASARAERLLGFWRFDYTITSTFSDELHMQQVSTETGSDGEIFVDGIDRFGNLASGKYSQVLEKFFILTSAGTLSFWYEFDIIDNKAVGEVLIWRTDTESIADALSFPLLSTSGRISRFTTSKPVVTKSLEDDFLQALRLPQANNDTLSKIRLEIFDAFRKKQ